MELIPTITDIILFITFALTGVLFISFVFYKIISKKNVENEEKKREKREYLRQYIANQRKFVTASMQPQQKYLNDRIYGAPTYLDRNSNSIRTRVTYTDTSEKRAKENTKKRYTIINSGDKISSPTQGFESLRKSFSNQDEKSRYKY